MSRMGPAEGRTQRDVPCVVAEVSKFSIRRISGVDSPVSPEESADDWRFTSPFIPRMYTPSCE